MYYGPDGKIYERTSYTDYEFNSKGDWIKQRVTTEETFTGTAFQWFIANRIF